MGYPALLWATCSRVTENSFLILNLNLPSLHLNMHMLGILGCTPCWGANCGSMDLTLAGRRGHLRPCTAGRWAPCPSPWPVWHLLILTLLQPMKQPLCLAILKEINKATKTSDEDEGRGIFSFSLFLHFFFYKGTQTQPQTDLSLRLCICRFKQQYGEFHMSVSWAYSYVLNWVYNFLLRVLCNRKKKKKQNWSQSHLHC